MPVPCLFNYPQVSPISSFAVLSRVEPRSLTMIDLFRSKEEVEKVNMMTGTYLTLKMGQELQDSYPAKLIKAQTCTSMLLPGAKFVKSRFCNIQIPRKEHEKTFRRELQLRGFNTAPILLSPLSSLAYCVVNSAHQGLALKRQSVKGAHLGYGRISVHTDKLVRIAKL